MDVKDFKNVLYKTLEYETNIENSTCFLFAADTNKFKIGTYVTTNLFSFYFEVDENLVFKISNAHASANNKCNVEIYSLRQTSGNAFYAKLVNKDGTPVTQKFGTTNTRKEIFYGIIKSTLTAEVSEIDENATLLATIDFNSENILGSEETANASTINVDVLGNTEVTNNAMIRGNLTITNDAAVGNNASIKSNFTSGNLEVQNNSVVNNDLLVENNLTSGNLDVTNQLNATGEESIFTIKGNSAAGTLNVTNNLSTKDLDITNKAAATGEESAFTIKDNSDVQALKVTNKLTTKDLEVSNKIKSTGNQVVENDETRDIIFEVKDNSSINSLEVTGNVNTKDLDVANKMAATGEDSILTVETNSSINSLNVTNNVTTKDLSVANLLNVTGEDSQFTVEHNSTVGNLTAGNLDAAQANISNLKVDGTLNTSEDVTVGNRTNIFSDSVIFIKDESTNISFDATPYLNFKYLNKLIWKNTGITNDIWEIKIKENKYIAEKKTNTVQLGSIINDITIDSAKTYFSKVDATEYSGYSLICFTKSMNDGSTVIDSFYDAKNQQKLPYDSTANETSLDVIKRTLDYTNNVKRLSANILEAKTIKFNDLLTVDGSTKIKDVDSVTGGIYFGNSETAVAGVMSESFTSISVIGDKNLPDFDSIYQGAKIDDPVTSYDDLLGRTINFANGALNNREESIDEREKSKILFALTSTDVTAIEVDKGTDGTSGTNDYNILYYKNENEDNQIYEYSVVDGELVSEYVDQFKNSASFNNFNTAYGQSYDTLINDHYRLCPILSSDKKLDYFDIAAKIDKYDQLTRTNNTSWNIVANISLLIVYYNKKIYIQKNYKDENNKIRHILLTPDGAYNFDTDSWNLTQLNIDNSYKFNQNDIINPFIYAPAIITKYQDGWLEDKVSPRYLISIVQPISLLAVSIDASDQYLVTAKALSAILNNGSTSTTPLASNLYKTDTLNNILYQANATNTKVVNNEKSRDDVNAHNYILTQKSTNTPELNYKIINDKEKVLNDLNNNNITVNDYNITYFDNEKYLKNNSLLSLSDTIPTLKYLKDLLANGYICLNNENIRHAYLTHIETYSTVGIIDTLPSQFTNESIEILNYPQPIDGLRTMPKNRMAYFYTGSRAKVAISITKNTDTSLSAKYEIINPGDIVVAIGNQNYFDGCSIADIKYNYVIIHKNIRENGLQTISEEFNSDSKYSKKLAVFSSEDSYGNIPYIMNQSDIELNGSNNLSGINDLEAVHVTVSEGLEVSGNVSVANILSTNTLSTTYISPSVTENGSLNITNSPNLVKNLKSETTRVSGSIDVTANEIELKSNTNSTININSSAILIKSQAVKTEGRVYIGSGELYGSGNLIVGASSVLSNGTIEIQNTGNINIAGEVAANGDKTKLSVYEIVPNSLNNTVDISDNLHVIESYVLSTDSVKDDNKTYYEINGNIYTVAASIPEWTPEKYYERKESIITGSSLTTENIVATSISLNNANIKEIVVETSADITSANITNAEIASGSISDRLTAGNLVIDATNSSLKISDDEDEIHTILNSNGISADSAHVGELITSTINSEDDTAISIGSSIIVNDSISGVTTINSKSSGNTREKLAINTGGLSITANENIIDITDSAISAKASMNVNNFILGASMFADESYIEVDGSANNYTSTLVNNSTNRILFIDGSNQIKAGTISELPNLAQVGSSTHGVTLENTGIKINSCGDINLTGNTGIAGDLTISGALSASELKVNNIINITATDLSTSDDLIELGMTRNGDNIEYSSSPYVGIYSYRSNYSVAQLNERLSGNGISISDISTTRAPESLLDLIENPDTNTTVKSDLLGGRKFQDIESVYKPLLGPYFNGANFEPQLAIYYVSAKYQNSADNQLNNLSVSADSGKPDVLNIIPVKDSSGKPVYLSRGFFIDKDGQCRVGIAYNSGIDDNSLDTNTSGAIIDKLSNDSLQYILTRSEIIKSEQTTEKTLKNDVTINDSTKTTDNWNNDYSQAPGIITALNMMNNRMEAANYNVFINEEAIDGFKIESGKLHVGVASENDIASKGFGLISALTKINIDASGNKTFSSSSGYASGLELINGKLGLNIATASSNGTVHVKKDNGLDITKDGEISLSTATNDGHIGAITVCTYTTLSSSSNQTIRKAKAVNTPIESGLNIEKGNLYLKAATESTNGTVHVENGNGLKISDGGKITMDAATATELGTVKVTTGNGLIYEGNTIAMNTASSTSLGAVQVSSGNGLKISDGGKITMDAATATELGTVKVTTGNGLIYEGNTIAMNVATNLTAGTVKVINGNGLNLDSSGNVAMSVASSSTAGSIRPSFDSNNFISYNTSTGVLQLATHPSIESLHIKSVNLGLNESNTDKHSGMITIVNPSGISIKYNSSTNQQYSSILAITSTEITATASISANAIKATSFNATSDKRLKTNITELNYSALDIVKDMKTYSFEYISDPDIQQIGVIAQELEDKKIGDFSFVSEDSNGYLSVKESKLVYLLIKAVQEQQKEIEELKRKINGED